MIRVEDYDFVAAERRARALVDVAAGTFDDAEATFSARTLHGADGALTWLARPLVAEIVEGCTGMSERTLADHGLVRALGRLRAHQCWRRAAPPIVPDPLRHPLEAALKRCTGAWSFRSTVDDLVRGYRTAYAAKEPRKHPPFYGLQLLVMLHEFGALESDFSRRDAYAGDVWLLAARPGGHDVSTSAYDLGLRPLGFLPPSSAAAAGHVVLACIDYDRRPVDATAKTIEWSGTVQGWRRERWFRKQPPLDTHDFLLPSAHLSAPGRHRRPGRRRVEPSHGRR